ncbi:hypothetical protein [Actinomadura madurae]|uniref:hypothetical protein n=1 Tax=Actinomadura madurae TaxID=1993 RepID=UPI0020D25A4B|nr:hypothetical protein [Actinomadura madurae]MCQ0010750.1 hypothetical protein [Actinomadura madurae]
MTRPTSAPAAIIVSANSGPAPSAPTSLAATIAENAITAATEMSMPRIRMTRNSPSASAITIELCEPRFVMFAVVRK